MTIYLDRELVDLAKARGLNMSDFCGSCLRERLEINTGIDELDTEISKAEIRTAALKSARADLSAKLEAEKIATMPEEAKLELVKKQYLDKKKWDDLHGGKKMDDAKWESFFESRAEWLGMDSAELKKQLEEGK